MKRTRIRPVSDRRLAEREDRGVVRELVFRRDGFRCQFPHRVWERRQQERGRVGRVPCWGLSPHHLEKSGRSGAYVVESLLSLCVPSNEAVEAEPNLARDLGLVIAGDVDAQEAQRRRRAWGSSW